MLRLLFAILILCSPVLAHRMDLKQIEHDDYEFVVPVTAIHATTAAVHEKTRWLIFGHDKGKHALSFFKLTEKGEPAAEPTFVLDMPVPKGMPEDRRNWPRSLQTHPTQPILYVWQDFNRPRKDPDNGSFYNSIEHLLVYKLSESSEPELVQAFAFGKDVASDNFCGEIHLDMRYNRLYIPNLRSPISRNRTVAGVGFVEVNEDGLVVEDEGAATIVDKVFNHRLNSDYRHGGFYPINDERIIIAAHNGPITWNRTDKTQRLFSYYAWPSRYNKRIAGHPDLPVFYLSTYDQDYVHCFEHVDGYPTLFPQVVTISGPYTNPIVIADRDVVAFGSRRAIVFICLNDEGRFSGEFHRLGVRDTSAVHAMHYSKTFDKLYLSQGTE